MIFVTRDQARDMAEAHNEGLHDGENRREGCPECEGRELRDYPTRPARPLGERQLLCLRALVRHGKYPGGWKWDNHSGTVTILNALVKRGLAQLNDDVYTPTDEGRKIAEVS